MRSIRVLTGHGRRTATAPDAGATAAIERKVRALARATSVPATSS